MAAIARILLSAGLASSLWLAAPRVAHAEDADAFYKQGLAYKQEGKADEAIEALEHAVAANPHHYSAWASLGNLYKTAHKDYAKSVTAYEHAVEGFKKDKVVWGNLGMAYYHTNQLDKALQALVTASQIDPNDAEIRGNLGTVRRQKGDAAGAVTDLEAAVRIKPTDAQMVNNLGTAYRFAKRDADAVKAYQKAIELSPNEAGFHCNLAVAYRRQTEKNPDLIPQAITEYETCTSLDPANADGWFDLGFMYKQDKDNDKAIAAFNKYLELSKGKNAGSEKRVQEELGSLGAAPAKPGKPPAKKSTKP